MEGDSPPCLASLSPPLGPGARKVGRGEPWPGPLTTAVPRLSPPLMGPPPTMGETQLRPFSQGGLSGWLALRLAPLVRGADPFCRSACSRQ